MMRVCCKLGRANRAFKHLRFIPPGLVYLCGNTEQAKDPRKPKEKEFYVPRHGVSATPIAVSAGRMPIARRIGGIAPTRGVSHRDSRAHGRDVWFTRLSNAMAYRPQADSRASRAYAIARQPKKKKKAFNELNALRYRGSESNRYVVANARF